MLEHCRSVPDCFIVPKLEVRDICRKWQQIGGLCFGSILYGLAHHPARQIVDKHNAVVKFRADTNCNVVAVLGGELLNGRL